MRAMQMKRVVAPGELHAGLELVELDEPVAQPGELLLAISACGVCHTELDELEGRLRPPRLPIIPGHQVVGRIVGLGAGVAGRTLGERVGVGWIHSSDGSAKENLSPDFRGTGCDVNGGYAEFMTVPAAYAIELPEAFTDIQAAPLLCAGAIGYRALMRSGLRDGERLGLTGFGGSAHLVLQLAQHCFPSSEVHVFARDPAARAFARELGATWAGDTTERAPVALDAIIDTTPAWLPVVEALANLAPGGRLVINAIRKEPGDQGELQRLRYQEHLWMEREVKSVANVTARDLCEFLPLAAAAGLRPEVETYPLERANEALVALRQESVRGAKVLCM